MTRGCRVRAFAKINLDLRVLYKRPDGFHELRTKFQTISLADEIGIRFTRGPSTHIEISSDVEIEGNLVRKAAQLCLDAMQVTGTAEFELKKRIPMGAGLGGGSSDAAAVLLALPVLAGNNLAFGTLWGLAAELGSDVTFFLVGGTAAGLGRGEELYPLSSPPSRYGVVISPAIHVSTEAAYRALSSALPLPAAKLLGFQENAWNPGGMPENDFEGVVFAEHPRLQFHKRSLADLGACPALLSGSGAALFGLFRTQTDARRAAASLRESLGEDRVYPISLVSRAQYRSAWLRRLQPHIKGDLWPPQSRYAQ